MYDCCECGHASTNPDLLRVRPQWFQAKVLGDYRALVSCYRFRCGDLVWAYGHPCGEYVHQNDYDVMVSFPNG